MGPEALSFIVFIVSMLTLMGIGLSMALALVLTGAAMAWTLDFWDTQLLAQNLVAGVDSFPLLAVPFFILAGVSVWLQMAEAKAVAIPAFVGAAGLILGGLVGLYSYLRKRTEEADTHAAEPPAELHLYRDYGFVVGKELYDKFTALHAGVRDAVKERNLAVDWPAHDKQSAAAEAAAAAGDWTTAFRDRFQALQVVATAYHKHLAKDETFRPNWMPHDKPAGGSKD